MVSEVNWSLRAKITFQEELEYLQNNFSSKEILRFTDKVTHIVYLLKSHPRLGKKLRKRSNVYKTVVNKKVVLYYQYKPLKKEIILMVFWNTSQNPRKLKV